LTTGDLDKAAPRTRRLRRALIVAVVVAVVLGTVSVLLFVDLLGISPCNGGIGLGLTTCPAEPGFQAEQLGHSQFVNESYVCNFIIYPIPPPTLYSTSLLVWGETLSGAKASLSSVVLYLAAGPLLTNYSFSGTNWTADKTVEIFEPVILTATSSTVLVGQVLVISDPVTHLTGFMNIH
jgi:hypothetical protein